MIDERRRPQCYVPEIKTFDIPFVSFHSISTIKQHDISTPSSDADCVLNWERVCWWHGWCKTRACLVVHYFLMIVTNFSPIGMRALDILLFFLWQRWISRQWACAGHYCFPFGNGVVSSRYCVPRFACYRQTIAWIFWTWKRVGRQPSGWWCAFFVSFQSFRWSLDTYKPHKFEETEGIASWSSKVHKEGCGDNNALMLGLVGYHFKDKPNKVYTMLQDPNSTCS